SVLAVQAPDVSGHSEGVRARPARDRFSRRHRAVEAGVDVDDAGSRLVVHFFQQQASPAFAFHQVPDGAGDQKMASVVGTFVPTYQGLTATHLVRRPSAL